MIAMRMITMRTIRARLIAGFSTSIGLLLLAGAVGWYGLTRSNAQADVTVRALADRSEFTERASATILRELVAGLRYLNSSTAANKTQYLTLVDQADGLRRDAIQKDRLLPEERRHLETIGQLQATLEVRIAITRAWQIVGMQDNAQIALEQTTEDMQAIENELQGLRRAARSGAMESVDAMRSGLHRAEISLAIVVTLAFVVAAYFGVSTSRAVTQPLARLRKEMAAIGAGDLRLPVAGAHATIVATEYADLVGAMQQARERLRSLLARVQVEADHVNLAASELSASASAAAASSQHVTTAVMDISHGASVQLDALNAASEAVKHLAEAGATIGEAADETERVGRDIRDTTNSTRDQVQVAIDTLLGAREIVTESKREMTALLGRVARTAQTYRGNDLVETAIELLVPGDRLLIRAGEVVPADGTVEVGSALLDESSLTGEALPVRRNAGAAVRSGVANGDAPFNLVVSKTAALSTYAGVVRLVDAARLSKAPMARLADRYAIGFLALTLALAAAAWFFTGDPKRALAVLVVATPCPLIIAVPVAIVAGMSRAAKRGLLVKSARILELLPQIRTVLIDKTGTLTDGQAHAGAVEPRPGFDDITLITAAASLAQASQHVVSQALVAEARQRGLQLLAPTDVVESPGDGVTGRVAGKLIVIGRPGFVAKGLKTEEAGATAGTTVLAVAINRKAAGRIIFEDRLREDAAETLHALRVGGIKRIVLLTGDQAAIAKHAGDTLGVDLVIAEATPAGKVDAVKAEINNGPVMMVGDGINDAPALAAADIGVALGVRGAAAASEAADIVLLVDRIDRVVDAMAIAKRTRAIALQSVVVGLSLSSLGMVAAALGYLPPLAGALSQEAIDVAVIVNALRALGPGQTVARPTPREMKPEPA